MQKTVRVQTTATHFPPAEQPSMRQLVTKTIGSRNSKKVNMIRNSVITLLAVGLIAVAIALLLFSYGKYALNIRAVPLYIIFGAISAAGITICALFIKKIVELCKKTSLNLSKNESKLTCGVLVQNRIEV